MPNQSPAKFPLLFCKLLKITEEPDYVTWALNTIKAFQELQ
jgi:hypothetical protein